MTFKIRMLPILATALVLSNPAFGQEDNKSAHSFSGACGTQGEWTRHALSHTKSLKSFITKLKDDPNCTALSGRMTAKYEQILAKMENSPAGTEGSSLRQEIGALRTFAGSSQRFQGQVMDVLTGKLVRHAAVINSTPVAESPLSPVQQSAKDLGSMKTRVTKTFNSGLQLMDETLDALPQLEECMTDSNAFGQYMASTVKLLGSFASSGEGQTGTAFAKTVSKFAEYARKKPFVKALRKLNQSEFQASLACILEVTSENYCSARDGQMLFNEMMKSEELVYNEKAQEMQLRNRRTKIDMKSGQNPLEGYYVLTQNVPMITEWLQMIQLGVEPRLPTDADQQTKVMNEVNDFYVNVKKMQGTYNSDLETLIGYRTLGEQQNQILKMVSALASTMSGPNFGNINSNQNFFTTDTQPMHIPFKLIGIPTPDAVTATGGGMQQDPISWLQANYKELPAFQNPTGLATTVKINMDQMIQNANNSAITYYTKWFIVDKVHIANKAILGHLYNVKESLREVDMYLYRLGERIKTYAKDKTVLTGVQDTRRRIFLILEKFKAMETLAGRLDEIDPERLSGEVLTTSEGLIKEVYDQFSVMLAKSGFLANRMGDFIQYDYTLMQRANLNMQPFMKDLYIATGKSMVNQVIETSKGDPAKVKADLALALHINKQNLLALEMGLADSYATQIAMVKHTVVGATGMNGLSIERMKTPSYSEAWSENIPSQKQPWLITNWKLSSVYQIIAGEAWTPVAPDSEFGSSVTVMNQLCVQTLAFIDLRPFWYMCKGAVLESPYSDSVKMDLTPTMIDSLNVNYEEKAWEKLKGSEISKPLNHSLRICALRDFSRKNLVLYLLQGQSRNDDQ
jgi:hypothetical protein